MLVFLTWLFDQGNDQVLIGGGTRLDRRGRLLCGGKLNEREDQGLQKGFGHLLQGLLSQVATRQVKTSKARITVGGNITKYLSVSRGE